MCTRRSDALWQSNGRIRWRRDQVGLRRREISEGIGWWGLGVSLSRVVSLRNAHHYLFLMPCQTLSKL